MPRNEEPLLSMEEGTLGESSSSDSWFDSALDKIGTATRYLGKAASGLLSAAFFVLYFDKADTIWGRAIFAALAAAGLASGGTNIYDAFKKEGLTKPQRVKMFLDGIFTPSADTIGGLKVATKEGFLPQIGPAPRFFAFASAAKAGAELIPTVEEIKNACKEENTREHMAKAFSHLWQMTKKGFISTTIWYALEDPTEFGVTHPVSGNEGALVGGGLTAAYDQAKTIFKEVFGADWEELFTKYISLDSEARTSALSFLKNGELDDVEMGYAKMSYDN